MVGLRDISLETWEILFGYLEPRHLARLVETGDKRVLYAIEHAWRHCNVVDFASIVAGGPASTDLMKRTLIGRARKLSIRASSFAHCRDDFLRLESLHLLDTYASWLTSEEWRTFMSNGVLDLAKMTPNLKSLKLSYDLNYRVTLPSQLESLELKSKAAYQTLAESISFEAVPNLTHLSVTGGFATSGVLSKNLLLPHTITSMEITLHIGDRPFIRLLPPSVTRLRIVNCISELETNSLMHMPLVDLSVEDAYESYGGGDIKCTWLGVLPLSLTSLSVGRLAVRGSTADLIEALHLLPPALRHISFTSLHPVPSHNEMASILRVLSPRLDLDALLPILLFSRRRHSSSVVDSALDVLVQEMLDERKAGPDFLHMIDLIASWRATGSMTNPIAFIVSFGMRPEYIAKTIANCSGNFDVITPVPESNVQYKDVVRAMRLGFVRKLKIDSGHWSLPGDAASKIRKLTIHGYQIMSFTSRAFSLQYDCLTGVSVHECAEVANFDWLGVATALCENIANMPRLETVCFDVLTRSKSCVPRLVTEMSKIGFRRINLSSVHKLVFRFFVNKSSLPEHVYPSSTK